MDKRIIEEFYDIGRIQRLVVMKQGTSSDAKCVESSAGRFILRKLRNEQQAVNEERLHHVMSLQNISPALVIARNGLSYIHLNDEIYTEDECFLVLENVLRGYAEAEGLLTRDRLYEQIHLWMLRGWLA
ncbi:hypothetical protein [Paenibacillus silvae]|uniref:hypothetical protein n=1 Tax=Paenibacillus silvae TaxID=1325358 RepID=UPI0020063A11|nr:hypothetical protein [Paenibacillus silvae]MCK6078897.1 hypothetical protein [Paenibacillus silvae]MCK6153216.1 hypothetical protein [Paenibacillus silvae]MCK6271422.1 hypothetical protein [Paenibacillus silvae]